jgi:hypothetical protein
MCDFVVWNPEATSLWYTEGTYTVGKKICLVIEFIYIVNLQPEQIFVQLLFLNVMYQMCSCFENQYSHVNIELNCRVWKRIAFSLNIYAFGHAHTVLFTVFIF